MKNLLIKRSDGSISRWSSKERNGMVEWNILRYDQNGKYLAQHSFGGICTREDFEKNMEMLKELGKETDFTVEEVK